MTPGSRFGRFARTLETYVALPLFALLSLAAIWIATLHFVDVEREAARNAASDATREQLDTYEAQMVRSLTAIDQTLKVVAYSVQMNGPRAALPALRTQGLLPPGLLFQVSVSDRDGRIVDSNPPTPAPDISQEAYFTAHATGKAGASFVSAPIHAVAGQEALLYFTRGIKDGSGRFAGVAIVAVDPAYFTSAYERSRAGERGLLALVGDDGTARSVRIGDKVSAGGRFAIDGLDVLTPRATAPDGVVRYGGAHRLHGFPLTAVVGLAADEQMAAFEQHRRTYILAASAASALLLVVVALISAWSWQLAKARRRERRAQETYQAASEASLDAVFVLRGVAGHDGHAADFLVEDSNRRAELLTGVPKAAQRGRPLVELLPYSRTNGMYDELARVVTGKVAVETEWQAGSGPNTGRWLQRQIVPVQDGAVLMVRDITERKQAEESARHMAQHDELTGLPNRSLIRERLDAAVHEAQRGGTHLALAFIDLDGFKAVNDSLGHQAGDVLLQVIGQRMQACLGPGQTLGRLGGDEFVILLPDVADSVADSVPAIGPLLERVLSAVAEPVQIGDQAASVGCSMGVAVYPRDGDDPRTLMTNADAAMYHAKELGKHNFQFYQPGMNAAVAD
ncbi:diguanylate cyclase (GGDEF)-like protein [Pseudoduganella lurida]|uniref:Diguanylate cyclase (GGDEF)-like protein n=1 Tax=Pseudoduganella lurida TaxID=1036180 RepID=A0A562R7J7_9BURK|nr:diguanylate cyclase [Pseudoduganella lurida]TWI64390.1 diguanylate cyclase (GGDEF)-like protein [Pseudoduganella lurida]